MLTSFILSLGTYTLLCDMRSETKRNVIISISNLSLTLRDVSDTGLFVKAIEKEENAGPQSFSTTTKRNDSILASLNVVKSKFASPLNEI